jgi:hypothetical protein
VAGFDETTLRSGRAGQKKYVHGAFTERLSAFWLGTRSLDSMEEAGILPDFAGIVVSDRYQNYFNPRWANIAGNQACLSHLLRDYEDCAETYPGAVWPVQAQQAVDGMGFSALGLRAAVEMCGVDRVVFGTDYGAVPYGIKEHVQIVEDVLPSQADRDLVFWKTSNRIFRLGLADTEPAASALAAV